MSNVISLRKKTTNWGPGEAVKYLEDNIQENTKFLIIFDDKNGTLCKLTNNINNLETNWFLDIFKKDLFEG